MRVGLAVESDRSRVVRFGVFEADFTTGELRKSGVRVKLEQQPFQVLRVLLQRPGDLVTREELREEVWSDETFVDFDQSLNTAIRKLRDTLGDSATHPRFIETLPRRGYRFVGGVDGLQPSEAPSQSAVPEPARRFGLPALLAAFALGAVLLGGLVYAITSGLVLGLVHFREAPSSQRTLHFTMPLPKEGDSEGLYFHDHLSPNGQFIAVSGVISENMGIFLRELDSLEWRLLPGTTTGDFFWSPDSRSIAFFDNQKLKSVSIGGGPVEDIADIGPGNYHFSNGA